MPNLVKTLNISETDKVALESILRQNRRILALSRILRRVNSEDYEYIRLGTISLLAAIDLLTGEAILI